MENRAGVGRWCVVSLGGCSVLFVSEWPKNPFPQRALDDELADGDKFFVPTLLGFHFLIVCRRAGPSQSLSCYARGKSHREDSGDRGNQSDLQPADLPNQQRRILPGNKSSFGIRFESDAHFVLCVRKQHRALSLVHLGEIVNVLLAMLAEPDSGIAVQLSPAFGAGIWNSDGWLHKESTERLVSASLFGGNRPHPSKKLIERFKIRKLFPDGGFLTVTREVRENDVCATKIAEGATGLWILCA